MIEKLRRILVVGKLPCSINLIQQLNDEAKKFSSSIDVFGQLKSGSAEELDSTLFSNSLDFASVGNLRKGPVTFNTEPGQLLAAAYIQECEHECESHSLLFHDKLHVNHLIWSSIQQQLLEHRYDSIVFLDNPQDLSEAILYQVAKALEIKIYFFTKTIFENYYFSYCSLEDCGKYRKIDRSKIASVSGDKNLVSLQEFRHSNSTCDGLKIIDLKNIAIFLLKNRSFRLFDPNYIIKRAKHLHDAPIEMKDWCDPYAKFFYCSRISYFEFLSTDYDEEFIFNSRFVFFPLQSHKELLSEYLINRYADQLLAIEQLARIIPKDCKIVIKDCSNSNTDYLTPMFYHRVNRISNVIKVPSCIDSIQLIKKCELFATINSNLGWQALNLAKRIVLFGHPWYRNLPGVFQFKENFQYNSVMKFEPNSSELKCQLQHLLTKAHEGNLSACVDQNRVSNNPDIGENSMLVAQTILNLVVGHTSPTFQSS